MLSNKENTATTLNTGLCSNFKNPVVSFAELLQYHELKFSPTDYYLQVGNIPWVQGWVLHISVIVSQLQTLLENIIPVILSENTAFKIVKDIETAKDLLDGHLGYVNLAKVVSIYPENITQANSLARKLITLTTQYRGPRIPTDIYLGGCVHARYGTGNPIICLDPSGNSAKFMYDSKGQLIPDPYSIPFILPYGVTWPFEEITSAKSFAQKKVLRNHYKPIRAMKADARGYVWKAVYLTGLFSANTCVIKQGRKNMCSDMSGQDIRDRLLWQQELHSKLEGVVPLPKIIDLFEEEEDTYLVMEIIKGISLYEYRRLINGGYRVWKDFPVKKQLEIIDYILKIILIVENLHAKGYVHRDITPVNFLIDQKGQIYLIDIELAYSLHNEKPSPPFGVGTPGFLSPEQLALEKPTTKEDIYGLCATLLWMLIGILPINFNVEDKEILIENTNFFICNKEVATIIAEGLNRDPKLRPELSQIRKVMSNYRDSLNTITNTKNIELFSVHVDENLLRKIIQASICSLISPPTILWEGLWLSKSLQKESEIGNPQKEYLLYSGLYEGIAGVLYFLSRANLAGYNIQPCIQNYHKGWDFLQSSYLIKLPEMPPGLYHGAAGLALAMASGIKSNMLRNEEDTRLILQNCFAVEPADFNISAGIAGQGISLLQCKEYLPLDVLNKILNKYVKTLLECQQRDGSWTNTKNGRKNTKTPEFGNGVAGIVWFLLEFNSHQNNEDVRKSIIKALTWLDKATNHLKDSFTSKFNQVSLGQEQVINDGGTGIVLTFIRAYKQFKTPWYRKIVEDVLNANPDQIINDNFSQVGGLAGLGEVYLEASSVFQNQKWKERAKWLVKLFMHTCQISEDGNYYWLSEQNPVPTAGLMFGNCGILHFLIRYQSEDKLGYCLLS